MYKGVLIIYLCLRVIIGIKHHASEFINLGIKVINLITTKHTIYTTFRPLPGILTLECPVKIPVLNQ